MERVERVERVECTVERVEWSGEKAESGENERGVAWSGVDGVEWSGEWRVVSGEWKV